MQDASGQSTNDESRASAEPVVVPCVSLEAIRSRRPAVIVLASCLFDPVCFGVACITFGPVESANWSSFAKRSTVLQISTPQRVFERRTENWRSIVGRTPWSSWRRRRVGYVSVCQLNANHSGPRRRLWMRR